MVPGCFRAKAMCCHRLRAWAAQPLRSRRRTSASSDPGFFGSRAAFSICCHASAYGCESGLVSERTSVAAERTFVRFCALIREHTLGVIECQLRIALSNSDLTRPHDVDRHGPTRLRQQRFHLLRSQRYLTGRERSDDKIAPVLGRKPVCVIYFFPPFQRRCPLTCATSYPRNRAP